MKRKILTKKTFYWKGLTKNKIEIFRKGMKRLVKILKRLNVKENSSPRNLMLNLLHLKTPKEKLETLLKCLVRQLKGLKMKYWTSRSLKRKGRLVTERLKRHWTKLGKKRRKKSLKKFQLKKSKKWRIQNHLQVRIFQVLLKLTTMKELLSLNQPENVHLEFLSNRWKS